MSQTQGEPPISPPAADERQPLLAGAEGDVEEQFDDAPPEKKRTWWTYGWYAVLTILGGVALGFFIKGFIDADDVEVRGVVPFERNLAQLYV